MTLPVNQSEPPEPAPARFADLMAAHQPRLAAYIRSLVLDEHASKDILQETNVTLLKKSRDFVPGTNFTAWSFRVAFFEVLSWRRQRGRDRLVFDEDTVAAIASVSEDSTAEYETRLRRLEACLRELPPRQREVVERRYLESEPVQEIAADLGFKANAASQLLFRARANLFKCLQRPVNREP